MKNHYKLKESLGQGSFGQVIKAKCLRTQNHVAIKQIMLNQKNQYAVRKVIREIEIQQHLSDNKQNVFSPQLLEVQATDNLDSIFLVMEHVNNDLESLFQAIGDGHIVLNED